MYAWKNICCSCSSFWKTEASLIIHLLKILYFIEIRHKFSDIHLYFQLKCVTKENLIINYQINVILHTHKHFSPHWKWWRGCFHLFWIPFLSKMKVKILFFCFLTTWWMKLFASLVQQAEVSQGVQLFTGSFTEMLHHLEFQNNDGTTWNHRRTYAFTKGGTRGINLFF